MLYYEVLGDQKETLVLLHGFMENRTMWFEMENQLLQRFRLVKIDLPGHGKSPTQQQENSMDFMAEGVNEVCDHLGLAKVHLLGHSMGGYVSLAFVAKYTSRVESLGLFFSSFLPDDTEKKEIRKKSLRIITENFSSYAHVGIPNLFSRQNREHLKTEIEFAEKMALQTPIDGVLAAVKGMMNRPNRGSVLQEFSNKILIILGRNDTAIDMETLVSNIPNRDNIAVYTLPCGHMGHFEKPRICAEIILNEF